MSKITKVTKENATALQWDDIRLAMEVSGISEEEAFEAYNKSLEIPFNPAPFADVFDDEDEE